jgi:hypothetical protein
MGSNYCPVREKANDVGSALCPFCPALQTPEIGYLKPPVNASKHRKESSSATPLTSIITMDEEIGRK